MSESGSGYPGAPPGWYADPAGGPGQRWWDGYAWTEATVQPAVPPPPPGAYPSQPLPAPPTGPQQYQPWVQSPVPDAQAMAAGELRISRWGRFAVAFPAITALVNIIAAVSDTSAWRNWGHQFRLSVDDRQANHVLPALPDRLGGFQALLSLCAIAALVVFLVWQYRAATTARALHLPALRSPGWGVAFWFIPVVSLWMPYQAIRDCLPAADPNRAVVRRYWACTLGVEVGTVATYVALMLSTPVGVAFALVVCFSALGLLAAGPKVVTSIAVAHQGAVNP